MADVGREHIKPGRVFTLHNKTGEYVVAYREKWAHLPAKVQLEKPSGKEHQFWEVVAGDAEDTIVLKNYKHGRHLVDDSDVPANVGYRKTSWQLVANEGKFWLRQKDDTPQMVRSENRAETMDLSAVWTSEWNKAREHYHYHWTFRYAPGHEVNEKGEKQQPASSYTPQANVTSDHIKPGVFTIHNQLIGTVIDYDSSERIQQGDPLNSKTKFWQIEAAGKEDLVLLKNVELGKYLKPTGIKETLSFSTEPYTWRILSGAVPDLVKIEHGPEKGQMLSTGISDPKKGNTIYSWTWKEYIDESFYWTFRYAKMDEIPKSKPSVAEMEEMKTKVEAQTKKTEASEKRAVEAEGKATATAQKVKDLESRAANAEKKAADCERTAADANSKAADSAKRVADLEKRIADSEKQKAHGEKKLSEAETKATEAETRAADAEKKATDATQRTTELEKQVEDGKTQQKKMENTIRHFQKGKFEAEQAQQSVEKELEEKQNEVDDLKKQLEEAKAGQLARKPDSAANEQAAAAREADLKEQEARLQQKERDLTKREAEIKQTENAHASASRDPNAMKGTPMKAEEHAPGYMPHLDSDCAFGGDHLFCFSAHQNHEFTFLPRLR